MNRRGPRGHANVRASETAIFSTDLPHVARIPQWGGPGTSSIRELPPLSLRMEEWKEIGVIMGWFEQVYVDALVG